jgi:hypothetical protein
MFKKLFQRNSNFRPVRPFTLLEKTKEIKNKSELNKDKDPNIALESPKNTPIKESKINEYFRTKIKKFDGRLN